MSAATEFPPVVYLPEPARRPAVVLPFRSRPSVSDSERDAGSLRDAAATVSWLYPVRPAPAGLAPSRPRAGAIPVSRHTGVSAGADHRRAPLRITRRGYVVFGLFAALLLAGLLWVAHVSALAAAPAPSGPMPAVVTVQDGDTLWSIASRIAPERDPSRVVSELEQRNGLVGAQVLPGQRLRTR